MLWLLYVCKFLSDFLCSDMSLLFVSVNLRGGVGGVNLRGGGGGLLVIPPQTVFVGGYTVFTLSVRTSDRTNECVSCFLNNFKNH